MNTGNPIFGDPLPNENKHTKVTYSHLRSPERRCSSRERKVKPAVTSLVSWASSSQDSSLAGAYSVWA